MPIKVTPIQPNDIRSAVTCIQQAFDDDPFANWAFDKRPGHFNRERNYWSLRAKVEWGMKHALFYVAKDTDSATDPEEVVGVSMWMKPRRPSEPQTWAEWWDEYVLWFKQGVNLLWYQGRGGLRTERYWVWKREQAVAQRELWTDPEGYYFVNIVTVRPGVQGKGVGRLLFEEVTKVADREGRRCYLESSKAEPNVRIYEKMGFDLRKKITCVSEDGEEASCDLFCMVREPQIPSN
jgi:GNAT superfamily N-acetyltransferase